MDYCNLPPGLGLTKTASEYPVGYGLRKEAVWGAVIGTAAKAAPYIARGLNAVFKGGRAVASVAGKTGKLLGQGAQMAAKGLGRAGTQFQQAGQALKAGQIGNAAKSAWQGTKTAVNATDKVLKPVGNKINNFANAKIQQGGFVNKAIGYGAKGVNNLGVQMYTPKNLAIGYGLDKGIGALSAGAAAGAAGSAAGGAMKQGMQNGVQQGARMSTYYR